MRGEVLVLTILLMINFSSNAQIPEEEPNNGPETAMVLQLGETISGSISSGDVDHFIFYLEDHTNVTIILESPTDIKFTSQMNPDQSQKEFMTEGKPLSMWYYLNPIDLGHRFFLSADEPAQYNLSLGIGNPVPDYGNHNQSTAQFLELNTYTNAILNVTPSLEENWYNFTILNPGIYQITANMSAVRDLVKIILYNESQLIASTTPIYLKFTISTMRVDLNPGNYSLKVEKSWYHKARPFLYELYVGSDTDLTKNGHMQVIELANSNDIHYVYTGFVSISPNNPDFYNFTIEFEQSFRLETNMGDEIQFEIIGNNETVIIDNRHAFQIIYGDYSLKVSSESGYSDFWIQFSLILPDRFDRDGSGRQDTPIPLGFNTPIELLTIHMDLDTDYFITPETESGTISVTVSNLLLELTFYGPNGEVIQPDMSDPSDYVFLEYTQSILIKVESEYTGIEYMITAYHTPDPVPSNPSEPTRELKISFLPVHSVILALIIIQRFTSRGIPLYLSKDKSNCER